MKTLRWLVAALTLFLCGAAPAPRVSVSANQLIYRGKTLTLAGVAVGDPFSAREGRPRADYRRIARDWNANAVRISLHPTVWKHERHDRVLDRLAAEIAAAHGARLFVILDWHTIGWPDGFYEKHPEWDSPADLYDPDFALALDFWTAAAKRFGRDGATLFELWNEPVFEKDEREPRESRWPALKPYFEKLIAAIRVHAPNVVLASGSRWAYDLRGIRASPLADRNTAYAWHVYAGHDDNEPARWAKALDDLDRARPVLVTEWGFAEGSKEHFAGTAEEFGQPFRSGFLAGRGLSFTAWCWHPEWTPALLEKDWSTPTPYGAFVLKTLRGPARRRP